MPIIASTIATWSIQVFCLSAAMHAAAQPEHQRQHQRIGRQRQRDRQPLQRRLRPPAGPAAASARDRRAAARRTSAELIQQRLVQAEVARGYWRSAPASRQPGDRGGRIAGDQVDHAEGDQADDQQDRQRAGQPPQDDPDQCGRSVGEPHVRHARNAERHEALHVRPRRLHLGEASRTAARRPAPAPVFCIRANASCRASAVGRVFMSFHAASMSGSSLPSFGL